MSMSCKVALAIDEAFWAKIEPFINDIPNGYVARRQETPDNTYLCLYWDEIDWERPETEPLRNVLTNIRHSLIVVNRDLGKVESNILTDDEWGCDGEFDNMLSCSIDMARKLLDDPSFKTETCY